MRIKSSDEERVGRVWIERFGDRYNMKRIRRRHVEHGRKYA